MINIESADELSVIQKVAKSMKSKAPLSVRVNPQIDAKTHPYITTLKKINLAFCGMRHTVCTM